MKMKKFLSVVCALSVVLSLFCGGVVGAVEITGEDLVSWQEYKAATEELYEKYNISGVSYEPVDGFYCTQDMLEQDLRLIEESSVTGISPVSFEEYEAAVVETYKKFGQEGGVYKPVGEFYCTPTMLKNDVEYVSKQAQILLKSENAAEQIVNKDSFGDEVDVLRHAMYVDVPVSGRTNIVLPPTDIVFVYSCTIQTSVTFKVDAQNRYIVSGGRPTLDVVSGTGIDDWVELENYSHSINQSKHKVDTTVKCRLKKSVTLGAETSWQKFSHTYTVSFYPS